LSNSPLACSAEARRASPNLALCRSNSWPASLFHAAHSDNPRVGRFVANVVGISTWTSSAETAVTGWGGRIRTSAWPWSRAPPAVLEPASEILGVLSRTERTSQYAFTCRARYSRGLSLCA
jgi:hypothetical protein